MLVSVVIAIFNTLAYQVCFFSMNLIRLHYLSELVAAYTMTIAFCKIFNTGIVLVLASARFDSPAAESLGMTSGQFYDIDPDWYVEVAPLIVQAYWFVVFQPIIDFSIEWPLRKLMQLYDHGEKCCFYGRRNKTR